MPAKHFIMSCRLATPKQFLARYNLSIGVELNSPQVKPAVWVKSSAIVGGWTGGSVIITPFASTPSNTFKSANSGMNFEMGSDGCHLPSSYRIIMATPVTGLVIE